MLRLLGFVFLVIICVETAPWGLVIGAILCVAWIFTTPAFLSTSRRASFFEKSLRVGDPYHGSLSAIPLVHAVYCANCDAITDSPHDACSSCGSHSIISVSRLWHLTVAHAPTRSARYKISFTADVREIPAIALSDTVKLIVTLAELGGDVKAFHIQVDSADASDVLADGSKIELVKPVARATTTRHVVHRQAS